MTFAKGYDRNWLFVTTFHSGFEFVDVLDFNLICTRLFDTSLNCICGFLCNHLVLYQAVQRLDYMATIAQVKAERIFNNARNLAIVEGKATGSNESQRTASLSQILAKESKTLDSANDKLTLAKLAMDLAYIDNQTNRYAIKAIAVTED